MIDKYFLVTVFQRSVCIMSLEASIFLVIFIISKESIMSSKSNDNRRGLLKYKILSNY